MTSFLHPFVLLMESHWIIDHPLNDYFRYKGGKLAQNSTGKLYKISPKANKFFMQTGECAKWANIKPKKTLSEQLLHSMRYPLYLRPTCLFLRHPTSHAPYTIIRWVEWIVEKIFMSTRFKFTPSSSEKKLKWPYFYELLAKLDTNGVGH